MQSGPRSTRSPWKLQSGLSPAYDWLQAELRLWQPPTPPSTLATRKLDDGGRQFFPSVLVDRNGIWLVKKTRYSGGDLTGALHVLKSSDLHHCHLQHPMLHYPEWSDILVLAYSSSSGILAVKSS